MKRKYIMLTLLIPGPKKAGNNIDVYLQPLIEDLKLLWDQGEKMYDAYSQTYFNLRAMIFCTISDFPGYGNLSGYTIKRAKACPICEDATIDLRLKNCKQNVYMGHRTFLPLTHPYRKRKNDFDGTIETRVAHFPLTGKEVFERVKDIDVVLGKLYKKPTLNSIWKKRSIFWDLPYWEHLQVRHCLDFMHIEKNVCESIIGTLLNIPGKTKDGMKARLDLKELGIFLKSKKPRLNERLEASRAFKLYVPQGGLKNNKKEFIWHHTEVQCPQQKGGTECDFFVMRVLVLEAMVERKLARYERFGLNFLLLNVYSQGMVIGDTRKECRTITRSLDIIKNRVSLRDLS
ncbi:hypothetical protein AgCh_005310 [Apium graveolens]